MKNPLKQDDMVVFLPDKRTIGWHIHNLLNDRLFPGMVLRVPATDNAGNVVIVQQPKSAWLPSDFVLIKDLDKSPSLLTVGSKVVFNYYHKVIDPGPHEASMKHVRTSEGDFHIGWCEEELRKEGIEFDKVYEIEKIEDDRILYLKGVKLGFYWKFFKKAP